MTPLLIETMERATDVRGVGIFERAFQDEIEKGGGLLMIAHAGGRVIRIILIRGEPAVKPRPGGIVELAPLAGEDPRQVLRPQIRAGRASGIGEIRGVFTHFMALSRRGGRPFGLAG